VVIAGHGISIDIPAGWEARIYRRDGAAPVLHAASFALHDGDGDFGAAATGRMRLGDSFAAMVEYLVDERLQPGIGLFAAEGVPPAPRLREFEPMQLEVTRPGQLGWQRFFTAAQRPCCLYAVIRPGAAAPAGMVAELGRMLKTLRLDA
jgi:hypothetical protein